MDSLVRQMIGKPTAATATSLKCASIGRRRTSAICLSIPHPPNDCRASICSRTNRRRRRQVHYPVLQQGSAASAGYRAAAGETTGAREHRTDARAEKGERAQFGCSARIRHTLAPDNSSLTFSSKADLPNHWLCCLQLILDRDWTWDALDGLSFVITRTTWLHTRAGQKVKRPDRGRNRGETDRFA